MNSYDTYGRLLQGSSRWNGEIVVHHLETRVQMALSRPGKLKDNGRLSRQAPSISRRYEASNQNYPFAMIQTAPGSALDSPGASSLMLS